MLEGLQWRLLGPHRGGRAISTTGVPGTSTYFFGAVGGGIWKTVNAGGTWVPIFDGQRIASIGALEVAPSDPNILYAGTGEADLRSDITFGDGVYKSDNGGNTWRNVGLRDSRRIARILIHPRNPNLVYAAVLGHAYGPNPERGVFRSRDGGATWQRILFKNNETGAIDLAFEPGNPEVIYAAMWQAKRPPWSTYPPIEGPGGGFYKSTDGGNNWTELTGRGLPSGPLGRIGIAVAPSDPRRVYALITAKDGGLFRSDDSAQSWTRVSADQRIRGRSWYFSGITVDPTDPNLVYCPNVSLYVSNNGGRGFSALKGAPGGDDYHYLWIDPTNPSHMALASDQGTVITLDRGKTWSSWYNQPTGQFYHVVADNQVPYNVYGSQQDSGTAGVASRSDYGSITFRDWAPVGGGESGAIAPDPVDPNIIFAGNTNGQLFRFDKRTGASQDISPAAREGFGVEINERKYRFTWTSPLVFSPQNPKALYFGSQFVLRTMDGGMSWHPISPDLTGDARKKGIPMEGGPVTVDNAKARGYGVVYSIAPSPLKAGQIWAGSDTGLIHLTRDDGKTWADVTPPELKDWSKIGILDASHHDPGTAYAAVDRHRLDDYEPYIYRTHDFGKTWKEITSGISAPAFVNAVREDPVRKGLLYAGTELGVYVSFDDGDHWQPLQLNLPVASVRDLVVKGNDLVVATHGRAFWVLDDVSPLRTLDTKVTSTAAHLFAPAVAMRMRGNQNKDTPLPPETPAGRNPPDGAVFYYSLPASAQNVVLEILDAAGKLIRRYASDDPRRPRDGQVQFPDYWFRPPAPVSTESGLHRWVWDLRYPAPIATHNYSMATAFGEDTAMLPQGPMVVPGKYQIRLTVDGKASVQPLTVAMDPRVKTPPADLQKQFDLGMKIWEALRTEQSPRKRAALAYLATVVDSGDRAPTSQAVAAFEEVLREK
jgi:photosystem II stability/assembly factor-like uncharacterized protein